MNISNINQILNNFKEVSKFYLELKEINLKNFTIYTSTSTIRTSPPDNKFYYSDEAEKTLLLLANTTEKITLIDAKKHLGLTSYDLLIWAGYIRSIKEKITTIENALSSSLYHLALYLSLNQKTDISNLFTIYTNLKLNDHLKEILKPDNEKNILILAKTFRKEGNIRKSLEYLNMVKSKEYEVEKNIEYAWLHYINKNYSTSLKIFEYYSKNLCDEKRIEASYGLALSLLKLDEKNIIKVKEILSEISKNESHIRLEILMTLLEIYFELKDYLRVIEISDEITNAICDIETLKKKCISLFLTSQDKKASDLLFEIGVYSQELVEEITKIIPHQRINPNPPPSFSIRKDEIKKQEEKREKKPILEALLVPEDTSKIRMKFSDLFSDKETENKDTGVLNKTDELSQVAFEFAKSLEEEFATKVLFNYEGLDIVERKLRTTFMSEVGANEKNYVIKGASSFINFLLKERFKAEIITYDDLDPWAYQAIIKNRNSLQLLTYPAARIWLLNWSEKLPQQGWLKNYINYIGSFMNTKDEPPYGKKAILSNTPSDPEKIFDASIEHKKILLIASSIEETSYIPINSSSIIKIESEIKKRFKPRIPPTRDGWKFLRCYAHIFLEIVLKELKPVWYNVEKNDGLWSFKIGERKFIFPIGKVYKTALLGETLVDYYENIQNLSKLRD